MDALSAAGKALGVRLMITNAPDGPVAAAVVA